MKALVILIPAALAAGCSGFERDWKAALATARPAGDPVAGPWQGEWRSQTTGHSGNLRALVTPRPGGGYDARYKARYACCFTFEYTVPMTVEREGDRARFHGTAALGFLAGGEYNYGGESTPEKFTCTYRSNTDQGVFEMGRPAPAADPKAKER